MVRKRNSQRSTCPEGWLKAGIKVPVSLTTRQEQHAARAVGAEEKTHLCGAVDVGIAPLAVDSELVHYDNPKALYSYLRKLRRWQRALERRTVGSRGWREAQQRINAIHRRIIGLREDAHHQVSRLVVGKYAVLAIESLNVAASCCSRSATRQDGTARSSWKRTASIRPASSAQTAALTMLRWVGNCTGPAHSAACDMTATRTPRSTCWA